MDGEREEKEVRGHGAAAEEPVGQWELSTYPPSWEGCPGSKEDGCEEDGLEDTPDMSTEAGPC